MILIELFLTFLKIGAFTFGGGYAMIAMIQYEAERHGWLTEAELVDFVALSESTPGPLMVNLATYIGSSKGGIIGAVIATSAVVFPAYVIILLIMLLFKSLMKNKEKRLIKSLLIMR